MSSERANTPREKWKSLLADYEEHEAASKKTGASAERSEVDGAVAEVLAKVESKKSISRDQGGPEGSKKVYHHKKLFIFRLYISSV